jgi:periplasmic protein TonB
LDKGGEPELKIDFNTQQVLLNKPSNLISKFLIADGDSFKEVKPEQEPIFLGGRGNIFYFLLGLQYPLEARRKGMDGTVMISATITKEGKIVDEKVESGRFEVLNNEALRVFQKMADDWLPGKVDGNTVDMRILMPVRFKLN